MPRIDAISKYLDQFAPTELAEDWDNVGLLAGDPAGPADRIMTCLTITPESAAEAIAHQADLIVAHHPLPFRPLKRITTTATSSRLLWDLIRAGVAIYSPHTGFDSAAEGINQSLGEKIGLSDLRPIQPRPTGPEHLGAGRMGTLPAAVRLSDWLETLKSEFSLPTVQYVGSPDHPVRQVGIACGSGGSFLESARIAGCDTFLTGETNFHTALESSARSVALVLLGHYTSERFAVEGLAQRLQSSFADASVWASRDEHDPLRWA